MAANKIDQNFINQYGKTINLVSQVRGGKFKGTCLEDTITGENAFYDRLGSVIAGTASRSSESSGTNTFADSPDNFIEHSRRMVTPTAYDVGLMLDRFDKVEMLVNPESEYVQQQVTALNRKHDIEFLKGALGAAATGKAAGGTSVELKDLESGQQIITDTEAIDGTTLTTGFNIEKIAFARQILESNGVNFDDPLNEAYIAVTPKQIRDLLQSEKATSSDYNTIKTLVRGEIDSFYGFKFIVSNLVPYAKSTEANGAHLTWSATTDLPAKETSTDTIRACFAYVKSGVRQVTSPSVEVEIDKRADKRFNWYSYACHRTGAVRMEEEKVVQINAAE